MQGLLPALAPILPHLAEDAWQSLPWEAPCKSVFQAGWLAPAREWSSLPEAQQRAFRALLQIRYARLPPLHSSCSAVSTSLVTRFVKI